MMEEPKRELEVIEDVHHDPKQFATEEQAPTAEEEARVVRKLDWRLMPMIFLIYMLSVLDRSNLGNAYVAGLTNSIDLSGNRYAMLGTVFYISCGFLTFYQLRHLELAMSLIVGCYRYRLPGCCGGLETLPGSHMGRLRGSHMGYDLQSPGCRAELWGSDCPSSATWSR